jgi:hypothetical protein
MKKGKLIQSRSYGCPEGFVICGDLLARNLLKSGGESGIRSHASIENKGNLLESISRVARNSYN